MDPRELFGSNGDDAAELPEPNAEMRFGGNEREWTPEEVYGILCNPVYAGIGPYPSLIDDKLWVRSACKLIDEVGAEQFLVNVLYLLRQTLANAEIDFG